jgi:hypothetical protein
MTINTWRNDILKVCKYCKQFIDRGQNRYRYQCFRFGCSIYEAHKCGKTVSIRNQASEMSKKLLDEAFFALTGAHR